VTRKHSDRVIEMFGGKVEKDFSAVSGGGSGDKFSVYIDPHAPTLFPHSKTNVSLKEGFNLTQKPKEAVDHPSHYNTGKYEVIDVIEDWGLGFHLGNVVKYVARSEHKGKEREDLEKALWYLTRKLEQLDGES